MGESTLEIAEVLALAELREKQRRLFTYKPYGHPETLCPDGRLWREKHAAGLWDEWSNKPWQLDFHNAGKNNQERMLIAANRPGKTMSCAFEVAIHATGEYPDWWDGKRFDHPVLIWTGSPTNETSRDIVQKELIGGTDKETFGTGTLPRDNLQDKPKMRQAGVSDVVDTIKVKHKTGGISTIILKTYEQGWRKWQGTAPHVVWMDEEPEDNEVQGRIRTEALTRLLTSHGIMMVSFTPLLGITQMVEHFQSGGDGIFLETATWEDAPHLLVEERERLARSYPEHERDARTKGVPMMGEGKVFTAMEEEIKIPAHSYVSRPYYAKLKGVDFGIAHPWAVADIDWDRDRDIIYVTRVVRKKSQPDVNVQEHAEAINEVNPWVPVAWPHDGQKGDRSGMGIKKNYEPYGVKFLSRSASYTNDKKGAQPVEPIVVEINERCHNGSFKVLDTCTAFFDEYRNYHRKDGRIVDRRDDAIKAVFYAVMQKRSALAQINRKRTRTSPGMMPRM